MAEQAKRAVIISVRFVGDTTARRKYFERVLRLVEEALASGDDYFDDSGVDKETHVLLQHGEFIGPPDGPMGAVRANLMFSTSELGIWLPSCVELLPNLALSGSCRSLGR